MSPSNPRPVLEVAETVLRTEANAILGLIPQLDAAFAEAVSLLRDATGRVVCTGMGKSGLVMQKVAATLASTGTPAFFLHPAEATHGDLGMVVRGDVVLAASYSGTTGELLQLVETLKRLAIPLVAMTGHRESPLARHADVHLPVAIDKEACPLNLAPTASTTATLALGDALAMALLEARGFTAEDFARSHPGGSLGRKLLTHVRDVMRTGSAVPIVTPEATLAQALFEITGKGMGMTAVVNADGTLAGMFTDGDLRRCLPKVTDFNAAPVADFMTRTPVTIAPSEMAVEAVSLLETQRKTQLLVVDVNGQLVGALHMHDLLRAKVV